MFGPRAQAHQSSPLGTAGSTRGPHTTPMSRQSDGFAGAAFRQHSVSPFAVMPRSYLRSAPISARRSVLGVLELDAPIAWGFTMNDGARCRRTDHPSGLDSRGKEIDA